MLLRNLLAFPFTLVTDVRNWAFNHGWLREERPSVPTVCIGNLAVGGTGKTPHTAWIAEYFIRKNKRVAILSRGYGRTTHGYYDVAPGSHAWEVGDEPLQLARQLPVGCRVAVCEKRLRGIASLLQKENKPEMIILDDAYQHRYVKPHLNILLTDYSRLYCDDYVMPSGRLRERPSGAKRADVIIVTKCPKSLTPVERRDITDKLHPAPQQRVLFSTVEYTPLPSLEGKRVVLVTGIARPEPLESELNKQGIVIAKHLRFSDHHRFTTRDAKLIQAAAADAEVIITTAKDEVRLADLQLDEATRSKIIVQHIHVAMSAKDSATLAQLLDNLVQ